MGNLQIVYISFYCGEHIIL